MKPKNRAERAVNGTTEANGEKRAIWWHHLIFDIHLKNQTMDK
jgi:hypothetical protein